MLRCTERDPRNRLAASFHARFTSTQFQKGQSITPTMNPFLPLRVIDFLALILPFFASRRSFLCFLPILPSLLADPSFASRSSFLRFTSVLPSLHVRPSLRVRPSFASRPSFLRFTSVLPSLHVRPSFAPRPSSLCFTSTPLSLKNIPVCLLFPSLT